MLSAVTNATRQDYRETAVMHPPCGIGIKPEHFADLIADDAPPPWVEVHTENVMAPGGPVPHRADPSHIGSMRTATT